jgi:hypothetical protein
LDSGTNVKPRPRPSSSWPGNGSAQNPESASSRLSRNRPTAASSPPVTMTGLGPIRGTRPLARPAESRTPAVVGSEAKPALTGVYPCTCWKYRLRKKKAPISPAPTSVEVR